MYGKGSLGLPFLLECGCFAQQLVSGSFVLKAVLWYNTSQTGKTDKKEIDERS